MPVKATGWARLFRLRWFGRLPAWIRKRAYAAINRKANDPSHPEG